MNLRDFEALTFDCYGTLIDWEGGIWAALQPILAVNRRNDVTRTLALSTFARLESEQESAAPTLLYSAILSRVHALFAKALELESTKELDTDFGNSVPHWPAFGDTADALRYLKTRYKLVILSNGRQRTAICCRRATLSRASSRRALKAEMRARTNDEIKQVWCRQTGD